MTEKKQNVLRSKAWGSFFQDLREKHNLSPEKLSDETGITVHKLTALEKGENYLTSGEAKKMTSYYRLDISQYFAN